MALKHLLRRPFFNWIIARIIIIYIGLVYNSAKKKFINYAEFTNAQENNEKIIFCTWHGRQIIWGRVFRNLPNYYVLASKHGDGQIVGNILSHYGAKMIYGSTNKGAREALRNILKASKEKNMKLAITPDGPRGPRMRINSAIIDIASISGAVIIPICFSCNKVKFIKSWDKFLIPYPFCNMTIKFAEKISIPKKINDTQRKYYKSLLEEKMNELNWELDQNYNHEKIEAG